MPLIKCPNCGQTVLSVASSCPRCSFLLAQNPMDHGGPHGLIECRRCQKFVPRDAAVCPYCAYPARVRKILRRIFGSLVGTGIVVAAAVLAFRSQSGGASLAEGVSTPVATQPPPAARVPERALPPTVTAPPAARDTTAAGAPGTVQRWTTDWVNIREGRAVETPSVRVVGPGTRLEVRNRVGGWWEVVDAGTVIGYVAGAVLATSPPIDSTAVNRDTLIYRE